MESIIVGVIFIIFGGLTVIYPSVLLRFQIWTQRVIMRAEYIPSRRTYTRVRIVGAFLLIIGLLALLGILDIQ